MFAGRVERHLGDGCEHLAGGETVVALPAGAVPQQVQHRLLGGWCVGGKGLPGGVDEALALLDPTDGQERRPRGVGEDREELGPGPVGRVGHPRPEVRRPLQHPHLLGVGRDAVREVRGPQEGVQRRAELPGLVAVVRGGHRLRQSGGPVTDDGAPPAVQVAPGVGQHPGQHGLAEQRVAERDRATAPDQDATGDRVGEAGVEVAGRERARRGEVGRRRIQDRQRGRLHDRPGRGRQAREAVPEQPVRQYPDLAEVGVHQLLDQHGHALGDRGDPRHVRGGERRAVAQLGDLLGDLAARQSGDLDAGRVPQARQAGEELPGLLVGGVVGPGGHQEQQPLVPDRPGQVVQEVAAGLVRPVHVLHHHDQRSRAGHVAQQAHDRAEDLRPGRLRRRAALIGRGRGNQIRGQSAQRRLATARHPAESRPEVAVQVQEHVHHRDERQLAGSPGGAAATDHEGAVAGQALGELVHQAGLADAGLAEDDGDTRCPGGRHRRQPQHGRELVGPTDHARGPGACHLSMLAPVLRLVTPRIRCLSLIGSAALGIL